jgi:hypothetical protein
VSESKRERNNKTMSYTSSYKTTTATTTAKKQKKQEEQTNKTTFSHTRTQVKKHGILSYVNVQHQIDAFVQRPSNVKSDYLTRCARAHTHTERRYTLSHDKTMRNEKKRKQQQQQQKQRVKDWKEQRLERNEGKW